MKRMFLFLIFSLVFTCAYTKTAEEWRGRVLYEIMVDRFYNTEDPSFVCSDLSKYCGGTFKGIEQNLDYIQGLGVNAIWISPVQPNTKDGYHGYWPIDFYGINPHFGTEQDFRDLVKACHDRDIWIMVDVVVNHVGYLQDLDKMQDTENNDYSQVVPFNDRSHFHKYEYECKDIEEKGRSDDKTMETCWLFWLPDLNHENPTTRKMLLDWISWLVGTYDIDGIRLDALRHVPKDFWKELNKASGVFTLGEAWHPDVAYEAEYQKYVDSVLNFPLQERLTDCLVNEKPMTGLSDYFKEAASTFPDITVLGNFLDCHDKPRLLSMGVNSHTYKSAITLIISTVGIPTIYYGNEQNFKGGEDVEANREAFWGHMNRESDMYKYISKLLQFRKVSKFYETSQVERLADKEMLAFTRGPYFFIFTNSPDVQTRAIENHDYPDGTVLCNLFDSGDCTMVKNKKFEVNIASKDSKVLVPSLPDDNIKDQVSIWSSIAKLCNTGVLEQSSL